MDNPKTVAHDQLLNKISTQLGIFNEQLKNLTKIIEDEKEDKKELLKKVDAKAEKEDVKKLTSFCDKHSDLELVKTEIDKNTTFRNKSEGIQQFIPHLLAVASVLYSIFSK